MRRRKWIPWWINLLGISYHLVYVVYLEQLRSIFQTARKYGCDADFANNFLPGLKTQSHAPKINKHFILLDLKDNYYT